MKFMNVISKFANKEEAVAFRNDLINKAEGLLNEGKMEEYNAAIEDVTTFDNEYRQYSEQKASIEAMKGAPSMANFAPVNAPVATAQAPAIQQDNDLEYRRAFMNYVLKGEKIPADLTNAAAYTTTGDVGPMVPQTVLNRIVELMETTGTILNKVTRTFFKGGVVVPTSAAKPVATWTTERGKVDSQKKSVSGNITFAYHKLKCVVTVSLAVDTITLDVFETTLVKNIAEAMVKAIESAIVSGDGSGKPKGILTETAPAGQNIEIAKAKSVSFADIMKAEGVLPAAYEGAEWLMTKKTFYGTFLAMVDSNGQPVARVDQGIAGKLEAKLFGRPVNFVTPGDMADYSDTVQADTVFAAMFKLEDYMFNTNLDITVKEYVDEETDDVVKKAVMLSDGKVVDVHSLVTMTKKSA